MTKYETSTVRIPVKKGIALSIHQSSNGTLETMPMVQNFKGHWTMGGNNPRRFTNAKELHSHIGDVLSKKWGLWWAEWEGDDE